jgi:SecD/SecF fusion protein
MPRAAFSQIVNRSMSEVLTRSLIAGLSTVIGVVCLLLFGGATLKDFAFAMLVGIASGTYSSIFIASPVLTAWKEREPEYQGRRERIESATGVVPAFAEEVPVAKVGEAEEPVPVEEEEEEEEEEVEEPALTPASQAAGRRSQADVLREAGLSAAPEPTGDGAPEGPGDGTAEPGGEEPTMPAAGSEKPAKRQGAAKRRQRGKRRKHGKRR